MRLLGADAHLAVPVVALWHPDLGLVLLVLNDVVGDAGVVRQHNLRVVPPAAR